MFYTQNQQHVIEIILYFCSNNFSFSSTTKLSVDRSDVIDLPLQKLHNCECLLFMIIGELRQQSPSYPSLFLWQYFININF